MSEVSAEYDQVKPSDIAKLILRIEELKETLGKYIKDGEYTGTKEQFLIAYGDYLTVKYDGQAEEFFQAVTEGVGTLQELYDELWGDIPKYKIASFTVTGAFHGSIGIVAQDDYEGRLVAKAIDGYTLTEEDLSHLRSDDK